MPKFKVGQRVHVEYEGVITDATSPYLAEVCTEMVSYHIANKQHITLLDPANWPPQVGDIWELDGEEYAARYSRTRPNAIVLIPIDAYQRPIMVNPYDLDNFKNSSPTLLRRRGE